MILGNSWYAIRVRSNYESTAGRFLLAKGYEVFTPTYVRRISKSGIPKLREVPLFKGYIFSRLGQLTTGKIIDTPGVLEIVSFAGKPAAINDEEIIGIQTVVNAPVARQPWKYVPCGSRIRIENGPLRGTVGILVPTGCAKALVVSISLLQRSVAVTLDEDTVITVLGHQKGDVVSDDHSNRLAACLLNE